MYCVSIYRVVGRINHLFEMMDGMMVSSSYLPVRTEDRTCWFSENSILEDFESGCEP